MATELAPHDILGEGTGADSETVVEAAVVAQVRIVIIKHATSNSINTPLPRLSPAYHPDLQSHNIIKPYSSLTPSPTNEP
jgi:hypothetical protein